MQKRKWQRKQKLSLIFEHIALLNLESRWGGHYFGFPKSFVDFSGQVALFRGNWELSLKLWGSFIPLNCWRHFTFQIHTRFDWDVKLVFSMKVFEKNKTCFIGSKYLPSLEFDISVGGIGKVCLPRSAQRRNWVFVSRSIYQMVSDLQLGPLHTFQDNDHSKFWGKQSSAKNEKMVQHNNEKAGSRKIF